MNHTKKIAKLLPEGIDAAIFTDENDRFWLTGFRSSAGTVVVGREKSVFYTDFRYIEAAKTAVTGAEVCLIDKQFDQLVEFLDGISAKKVALRDDKTTVRTARQYETTLPKFHPDFSRDLADLFESAVMIKDEEELAAMRKAQQITDEALAAILPQIKVGMPEKELAAKIEDEMKKRGAEGVSFDLIVVSGKKSAMPHGVPDESPIQNNAFLTMDIGCKHNGYCSDMTRTVCVGEPSDEMKKIYEIVLEAQKRALAAIAPGKVCSDIDKIARDYIYQSGYEGCFGHGLGHGLGVMIHENPRFTPSCNTVLQPGMVLSVEPGIYLEGKFGVRIEDVIFVTETGCENITNSPKELICL
ncbi:MAG TPA: Xaa-Pro peptidase family protein [Oscillospiraceae bacterium]|nr:Xaa-Pro peptidase family protein [Oscillospiraceae bacterium]HPS35800.1 Xaa-Pro peptidase family protein [Oscillospiraceae bacterium]